MADELPKVSQYGYLFDDSGDFAPNADDFVSGLEIALSLWKDIEDEQAKFYSEQEKSAKALEEILEDERKQAEAANNKAIADKKAILKIEMQIAKAIQAGSDTKQLEKRLQLVQKTQDIEKKTQALVNKYQDDLDAKEALRKAEKENLQKREEVLTDGLKSGNFQQMKDALTNGETGGKAFLEAGKMIANLVQKLDDTIQEIASYKSDWDTRLFGSGKSHMSVSSMIQFAVGASPYVKQADIMKNIDKAIDTGIAYNIEQRAFLETIKDDIAGTFDAFDSTLLQIVRVQQSDSTAARMGMEAALNQHLNQMFKNTEYLNNLSDTVTSALYQATSLLTSTESIGFEYQVQKWLGSLYSVGMSQGAVSGIAEALGQLASGNVSGTTSGAGKLLVMAASRAGLNYSDLLTKGINDSDINMLMESMVEYLKTIADTNKVVQTQLAGVFGLTTSDIQAAGNLSGADLDTIYGKSLSYAGGIASLNKMAGTIMLRQSMGEMMSNLMENFQYTMAQGMANNPVIYTLWTISNMMSDFMEGIPIPAFSVMGNMVDLETDVATLMKVGAMSADLLSGIGSIVSGVVTNSAGLAGVLAALGVSSRASSVVRGGGLNLMNLSETTSVSSYQGNTSGSDVYDSSMASADDQKNEIAVNAQQEEQTDIKLEDVNNTAIQIRDLLETVIVGGKLRIALGDEYSQFHQ